MKNLNQYQQQLINILNLVLEDETLLTFTWSDEFCSDLVDAIRCLKLLNNLVGDD